MHITGSCLLILGITGLSLATPAAASTLNISDTATTGLGSANTQQFNSSPTASTILTGSGSTPACTDPKNCATANYSVSDQFGRISLAFSTYASCTYSVAANCGPSIGGFHYAEAEFNGVNNNGIDGIQIGTIPGGSGLLELQYLMQGTIGAGGGFSSGNLAFQLGDNNNNNTVAFSLMLQNCPSLCGPTPSSPYFQNVLLANGSPMFSNVQPDGVLANTWDYSIHGTMIIPVTSNSADAILNRVDGASDIVGGLYDVTGTNLLSGVTINSTSGYDYTRQIVSAPEPAAFGMIAIGLVVMAFRPRSWRSSAGRTNAMTRLVPRAQRRIPPCQGSYISASGFEASTSPSPTKALLM